MVFLCKKVVIWFWAGQWDAGMVYRHTSSPALADSGWLV